MNLVLFLDDMYLAGLDGVQRVWEQPEFLGENDGSDIALSSVIFDPSKSCFRAWSKDWIKDTASLYESDNGLDWHLTDSTLKLFPKQNFFEQNWLYDPFDSNPEQRYKMISWPYEENTYGGRGVLSTSPDGDNWTLHKDWKWSNEFGNGSDTNNNIFYNPHNQTWNIICRKFHADRRVVIVQSKDLINWSKPRIILQPDALDKPLTEFYGMDSLLYENEYFIGALQVFATSRHECGEKPERIKMSGHIYPQLTYSYDGEYWQRSGREQLIPYQSPGSSCSSVMYPTINQGGDKKIYFHVRSESRDHGVPENTQRRSKKVYTMRRDGFAALTPVGGCGEVTTQVFAPEGDDMTINYFAPYGEVAVQITDFEEKPIPGFTYEDAVVMNGDSTDETVKWKSGKTIADLKGELIRIQIRLLDAKLYALRMKSKFFSVYTVDPVEYL